MTVKVYRVYTDMSAEPKDYAFSILASEGDARYVMPEKSAFGIDNTRIEEITRGYYENGQSLPEDPIGWASLAMENMSYLSMVEVEDSDYITMAEAEEEETAFVASLGAPLEPAEVEEE